MSKPSFSLSHEENERATRVAELARSGSTRLAELIEFLNDPSWPVRRLATSELAKLGDVAFPSLCETLLTHRDSEARIAATVDALATAAVMQWGELEELAATNPEPAVLADIANILGRRRAAASVPLLNRLVRHENDIVAVAAIEALGRIGGPAGVQSLIEAVSSGVFFRTFPAIEVLSRSGDPRAIAPLVKLLGSQIYTHEVARALASTADVACIPALTELLKNGGDKTVRIVATSLFELSERYHERFGTVTPVQEAMRQAHPGPQVTRRLVQTLDRASANEKIAIAFVLSVLAGEAAASGLRILLDAGGAVSEAAVAGLRQLGIESDFDVKAALVEPNSDRRKRLLPLVSRINAASEVYLCLDDEDPDVQVLACEALARIGATSAVPRLFGLLEDSGLRVTYAAIAAIHSLGSDQTTSLALAAAKSSKVEVRRAAVQILSYFAAPSAGEFLLSALHDPDAKIREAAMTGLIALEDAPYLDAVIEVTKHGDERSRAAAIRAIGHSRFGRPDVMGVLRNGITDSDPWVRYYACQAIGRQKLGSSSGEVAALLHDPAGQVRVAAVEVLALFADDLAVQALTAVASGDDPDMQRAALIGLGLAHREDVLAILGNAAQSPDPATRLVALSAISESGSAQRIDFLLQAMNDPDENVRSAAIEHLAQISGSGSAQALFSAMAKASARERSKIRDHLSRPHPENIAALRTAINRAEPDQLPDLTAMLVRMGHPSAERTLRELLREGSPLVRRSAASGLAAVGSDSALGALQTCSEQDPDLEVRQICNTLLAR